MKKCKCPKCGSFDTKRTVAGYVARTVSNTAGLIVGGGIAIAGQMATMGRAGSWIAKNVGPELVKPITDIVHIWCRCNCCGYEFKIHPDKYK